jgi:hypothetical protein
MTYFPRDCVPGPGFEVFIFVKDSSLNPGRQNRTGIWQRWGCRASRNAFWFGSIPSTIHEHVSVAGAMTPFSNFGTSSTFFRILPMKCKRRKNSALITSKHTQWYILPSKSSSIPNLKLVPSIFCTTSSLNLYQVPVTGSLMCAAK